MKITFTLLFVRFMKVSASLYSQDARVSIQVKETLIEDVTNISGAFGCHPCHTRHKR